MTVIARDAVASDHLVYAWPFPIGPECEVACGDDEQVVMCPAWLVGDRLGPGRHRWRTPDPTRPVAAFFVLTAPVEVSFDMTTMFIIPTTGQPVRLRASGSLQVRCADPGLLIAQFVGLPFDSVNDGILRSVSRSVERMLARLLTRRAVMAASPVAVTDPGMLPGIIEELVAYNPTAGAVFGVELIRMGHLAIVADDGSTPYLSLPASTDPGSWSGNPRAPALAANGETLRSVPSRAHSPTDVPLLETARQVPPPPAQSGPTKRHASVPPIDKPVPPPLPPPTPPPSPSQPGLALSSGEIRRPDNMRDTQRSHVVPPPAPRRIPVVEMPSTTDEITQPGVHTPVPGSMKVAMQSSPGVAKPTSQPGIGSRTGATQSSPGIAPRADATPPVAAPLATPQEEPRGSILGIGMGAIGAGGAVAGEIPTKVAPGGRVLVPGPNGLMQSATVRQLLQGYYELEVGSSGETIWVPISGVVPE